MLFNSHEGCCLFVFSLIQFFGHGKRVALFTHWQERYFCNPTVPLNIKKIGVIDEEGVFGAEMQEMGMEICTAEHRALEWAYLKNAWA